LTASLTGQINVDAQPIFNTNSGSVGSFPEQTTISTIDIEAYDPESAGNVTFELQSGSLPAGLSATTVHENGVSKYRITGTLTTDQSSLTTTTFVLRAVDAASNTSSRSFSISEVPSGVESFTSSGTFSVPTGITSVDVLVIAGGGSGGGSYTCQVSGGGGGAGGLVFIPSYSVSPGGTISVTVGCGGTGIPNSKGQGGQDSVFGTITAKGGGAGATYNTGAPGDPGGSGGGGGNGSSAPNNQGGTATQPTQPGQSGAYGFGNPGGPGQVYEPPPTVAKAGGGGGAGAAGAGASPVNGGVGKAYTIADGTTPVYYAGGGGGAGTVGGACGPAGLGGQGGGGKGGYFCGPTPGWNVNGGDGTANRGGGGGGAFTGDGSPGPRNAKGGDGGKGIVIVKY
jgi:hypothetical protein